MKVLQLLLCLISATLSMSCSSSDRKPVDSAELKALSANERGDLYAELSSYAMDRGYIVTENEVMKDGRTVSMIDIKYQDCLAITGDNFKNKDAVAIFFYDCPGFDWKKERSHLNEQLERWTE